MKIGQASKFEISRSTCVLGKKCLSMWNIVYIRSVKMFVLHFVSRSENIFAENLSGTGVIRLHCLEASFLDPIPNVS